MTENDIIGGCRTVEFAITITIACWLASLPRTFSLVSKLGTISALFTFVGYIVTVAFAAKQSSPAGYDPIGKGEPVLLIQLPASTTFSQGLTAVLTISVTMFGQLAVPSFVAEMREPREFPKSLLVSVVAELVVFSVVGATIYAFTGQQYVTSPAFGALQSVYKKISFTFMVPSILFVGALYASFTARFIFFRIFRDSKHTTGHTLVGWLSWSSILLVSWISAFLVAEVIPFFSALLSLSSALFTSWCGLIFWGVACLRMRGIDRKVGRCNAPIYDFFLVTANSGLILAGIFCLTAGTYASIDVTEEAFRDGQVQGPERRRKTRRSWYGRFGVVLRGRGIVEYGALADYQKAKIAAADEFLYEASKKSSSLVGFCLRPSTFTDEPASKIELGKTTHAKDQEPRERGVGCLDGCGTAGGRWSQNLLAGFAGWERGRQHGRQARGP
ncbi:hypothetical protein HIM_10653 [Hirsutella minnesotensis 3608]|uniref:Amino acid transporter transmembrane domain-containing protein n=1 Tax=Hirsutella minnesotensis 3608 TaxID=1043627 RepID=A0A0F7ZFY7_9HYPO|nr:hypothetical protein HIM_10653 [Hirsutella minnesotensis 3608]